PIVRQYEQEMNRKLLNKKERQEGHYFKFNLGGLLRGDTASRTAYYQAAIRSGWLSQDDVLFYSATYDSFLAHTDEQ
ncbi:phage portal protein, partial [Escherichia sp. R-CC3]